MTVQSSHGAGADMGILSAAVLRLFMIALGAELIERSQVRG